MADSNQTTANPVAQTAGPQRALPDGTGQPVPLTDRACPQSPPAFIR
jgi:hypothetical protein